jgi:hypothetical protein
VLISIIIALLVILAFRARFIALGEQCGAFISAYFRGKRMRYERERQLNSDVADALTEVIEDWKYEKKITDEEAKLYYRRFGKLLGVTDCLPKNDQTTLKEDVEARVKPSLTQKLLMAFRRQSSSAPQTTPAAADKLLLALKGK